MDEAYASDSPDSLLNRGVLGIFHHSSNNVSKNLLQAEKAPSA
jgi:hypothetical protein